MNKRNMLKVLVDDLKSKTDEEIIKDYKDSGIDVISYEPGAIGKVIIKG